VSDAVRAALAAVMDALDYGVLGAVYCDEGGDAFWEAKRPEVVRCGEPWARALIERLPGDGTSLYVGAGVAELPAMITEAVELRRTVRVANLREAECRVLSAALAAGGVAGIDVAARDGAARAGDGPYDHLCVVSVLTDPETWPVLSAVTYGHPADVDPEQFPREHGAALALARALFDGLARPGWITTTFEEAPWFLRAAAERAAAIEGDEQMIESPLVGDPIGFLRATGS